jgi:hypothetical protein
METPLALLVDGFDEFELVMPGEFGDGGARTRTIAVHDILF